MRRSLTPLLYSGAGNTFVLIDARTEPVANAALLAQELCQRHGVDGLLLMENTPHADIRMRILNPDGSEADMCGNGSRCAAYWAHREAGFKDKFVMETAAGLLNAQVSRENAKIRLTDPKDFRGPFALDVDGHTLTAFFVNTGVPHTVIPVQDLHSIDVNALGPKIRNHEEFKPKGTNVSFMKHVDQQRVEARTYERGVEGETQACGTGAAACALVASHVEGWKSPIEVLTASGEILRIYFKQAGDEFTDVHLEGPVTQLK